MKQEELPLLSVTDIKSLGPTQTEITLSNAEIVLVPSEFVRRCGIAIGDQVHSVNERNQKSQRFTFFQPNRYKGEVSRTGQDTKLTYPPESEGNLLANKGPTLVY